MREQFLRQDHARRIADPSDFQYRVHTDVMTEADAEFDAVLGPIRFDSFAGLRRKGGSRIMSGMTRRGLPIFVRPALPRGLLRGILFELALPCRELFLVVHLRPFLLRIAAGGGGE